VRDLFLLLVIAVIAFRTITAPQAGIMGWTWLTLMTPQRLTWGFAYSAPFNLLLTLITFGSLIVKRERTAFRWNALVVVWLLFIADITLAGIFSLSPDITWDRWERALKVMALGLCIPLAITDKHRMHALILVIAVSLCFFGVKGGLFTLITGGVGRVEGSSDSPLGDNNYLALALCLVLPLVNYIRLQSQERISRIIALITMVLVAVAVLGTFSRGGLVGISIMAAYILWTSRQRLLIAVAVLFIGIAAMQVLPASWLARMETIRSAQSDESFQERLDAWRVSLNIASERPLVGSGMGASEDASVYGRFIPADSIYILRAHPRILTQADIGALAYHSIYFQVLGDNGYPGLLLFLGLLALTWRYLSLVRRAARASPENEWASDLAAMIQVSLVSYAVAGSALSMAYYDMPYLFMGITIALGEIVRQSGTDNNTESQALGRTHNVPAVSLAGSGSA
jgi:probable O-glycosylation ligase (exosortase A-associated)